MSIERYANGATTTLNGSILSGASSLTVTDASLFPTSGNFRILINSELILVTAVAGNVFTIRRGIEVTTAAAHGSGDTVTQIVTAASILRTIPFLQIIPPLAAANWTWYNQGTATLTDMDSGVFLEIPASGGGDNLRGAVRPIPTAPYTITALTSPIWSGETFARQGIGLTDGTKATLLWWDSAGSSTTQFLVVFEFSNATNFFSAQSTGQTMYSVDRFHFGSDLPLWLRIRDDNTDHHFEVSKDRMKWFKVATRGRTAFQTATHAGIFANGFGSAKKNGVSLLSWEEE